MKRYGLIVADNGSDMYVTGTYDVNWNNDVLNPAFSALTASDFEVVQLGWKPSESAARLSSLSISPSAVFAGNTATGTVGLDAAAPPGGARVELSSAGPVSVPASVTVPAGASSADFPIAASGLASPPPGASVLAIPEASAKIVNPRTATISADYAGATKTAVLTIEARRK
jgi:hypothetical protein